MEVTLNSTVISFVLVAFLSCAGRVLNWLWLRPKKLERLLRQQGFKGNPYRLFYGDSKQIYAMIKEARSTTMNLSDDIVPHALPFYHHSVRKYGKNSFAWVGPIPRVNILDPKLIKEVLLRTDIFQKVKHNPISKLLVSGIAGLEDEKWAKHRKILNQAFYLEKLKELLPAMYLSCSEMMSKWKKLVSEKSSCELDVWPYLLNLSCDVISRTAFGSSYEEGGRIFELQREQCELAHDVLQSFYIPGWRFLPTKRMRKMKEIYAEVQGLVRGIINKRERLGEVSDSDLLGVMLKSNQNEIKEQGNKDAGMSIEEIIDECKLFYFAGQENTADLLVWTMVMLSMHPNWQVHAREEVQHVFGNNEPDYDGLNRLKIVTMILNEVLRLYTPSSMVTRVTCRETKLGDMTLPPGVQVLCPLLLVHHDNEIWGEDAEEFKPERFSEGVAKATKNQGSFLAFGSGPRICIGYNFAMLEAKMAIAMILRHFSFELSPSYQHSPSYIASLDPQHGARMILHKI